MRNEAGIGDVAPGDLAPSPRPSPPRGEGERRITALLRRIGPWLLPAAVLLLNLPTFVCRGLDSDVTMYDLSARNVLTGGVAYRDMFEMNLPGMIWLHVALRSLLGWRPEALRLVDVAVVASLAVLLTRHLPRASTAGRAALAAMLLVFYFSTTEWCHCQRDTWMLLPALGALELRRRRREGDARGALVEGLLWGVAFWIKPYVALPALACWLLDIVVSPRRLLGDTAGLLMGGLGAGAVGVAWLVASGAWPAFADILFVWNREYVGHNMARDNPGLVWAGFLVRFFPWVLVHFLAVPLAIGRVREAVRDRQPASALLAACYLGWTFQAFLLQHLFDYIHVPAILLGLTLVAERAALVTVPARRAVLVATLALGVVVHLPRQLVDARLGPRCLQEGSTPELRDALTRLHKVDWVDLTEVRRFLEADGVGDGELTCFSMPAVALFEEMGVRPSTRCAFLQNILTIYTRHRPEVRQELVESRQRFVVCDLKGCGMDRLRERLEAEPYPRLVFRAGRYVVFRLDGPEMPAWLAENFGL